LLGSSDIEIERFGAWGTEGISELLDEPPPPPPQEEIAKKTIEALMYFRFIILILKQ
jgi:hypothetical protein